MVPARDYNTALTIIAIALGVTAVTVTPRFSSHPASDTLWAIVAAAFYAGVMLLVYRYMKIPLPGRVQRVAASELPPPAPVVAALLTQAGLLTLACAIPVGFYLAHRPHPGPLLGSCLVSAVFPYCVRRLYKQVEHDNHAKAYVTTQMIWSRSQNRDRTLWLVADKPDV